jgi:hypothetical protein
MLFWWACSLVNLRLEQSHNCVSGRVLCLQSHVCDSSHKWHHQYATPVAYACLWLHKCDSSHISASPVTTCDPGHMWPFVLEITPPSITYDVIAWQSSTNTSPLTNNHLTLCQTQWKKQQGQLSLEGIGKNCCIWRWLCCAGRHLRRVFWLGSKMSEEQRGKVLYPDPLPPASYIYSWVD